MSKVDQKLDELLDIQGEIVEVENSSPPVRGHSCMGDSPWPIYLHDPRQILVLLLLQCTVLVL